VISRFKLFQNAASFERHFLLTPFPKEKPLQLSAAA